MKTCNKCGESKPLSEFKRRGDAIHSWCKTCGAEYSRAYYMGNQEKVRAYRDLTREKNIERSKLWRTNNPNKRKEYYEASRSKGRELDLKKKYGINLVEYSEMLAEQGGLCAICRGNDNGKTLAVDHCHETGRVRGLLCRGCNVALGLIKDNEMTALKMYKYLAPMGGLEQLFEVAQTVTA